MREVYKLGDGDFVVDVFYKYGRNIYGATPALLKDKDFEIDIDSVESLLSAVGVVVYMEKGVDADTIFSPEFTDVLSGSMEAIDRNLYSGLIKYAKAAFNKSIAFLKSEDPSFLKKLKPVLGIVKNALESPNNIALRKTNSSSLAVVDGKYVTVNDYDTVVFDDCRGDVKYEKKGSLKVPGLDTTMVRTGYDLSLILDGGDTYGYYLAKEVNCVDSGLLKLLDTLESDNPYGLSPYQDPDEQMAVKSYTIGLKSDKPDKIEIAYWNHFRVDCDVHSVSKEDFWNGNFPKGTPNHVKELPKYIKPIIEEYESQGIEVNCIHLNNYVSKCVDLNSPNLYRKYYRCISRNFEDFYWQAYLDPDTYIVGITIITDRLLNCRSKDFFRYLVFESNADEEWVYSLEFELGLLKDYLEVKDNISDWINEHTSTNALKEELVSLLYEADKKRVADLRKSNIG